MDDLDLRNVHFYDVLYVKFYPCTQPKQYENDTFCITKYTEIQSLDAWFFPSEYGEISGLNEWDKDNEEKEKKFVLFWKKSRMKEKENREFEMDGNVYINYFVCFHWFCLMWTICNSIPFSFGNLNDWKPSVFTRLVLVFEKFDTVQVLS